jgi:hypothetical protein
MNRTSIASPHRHTVKRALNERPSHPRRAVTGAIVHTFDRCGTATFDGFVANRKEMRQVKFSILIFYVTRLGFFAIRHIHSP